MAPLKLIGTAANHNTRIPKSVQLAKVPPALLGGGSTEGLRFLRLEQEMARTLAETFTGNAVGNAYALIPNFRIDLPANHGFTEVTLRANITDLMSGEVTGQGIYVNRTANAPTPTTFAEYSRGGWAVVSDTNTGNVTVTRAINRADRVILGMLYRTSRDTNPADFRRVEAGATLTLGPAAYNHNAVPNGNYIFQDNGIIFFKDAAGVVTRIAPPA